MEVDSKLYLEQKPSCFHFAEKCDGEGLCRPCCCKRSCAAANRLAEITPLLTTAPLPPAPSARAEPEQSRIEQGIKHMRSGLAPPFSLSFSVSLLYIPRFTCLCFLSSMLWQWCSMLMRQCVVQPQAVIFQVISRVMNTHLLLFHPPSRKSGFLLHQEGPLAMMVILGCFLPAAVPAHQCRSQV